MIDYKTIGRRIKWHRQKAGLKQAELAEELDISVGAISQIECGKTAPSLERLDSIACALFCDLQDLIADCNTAGDGFLMQEILSHVQNCSNEQRQLILRVIEAVEEFK